MTTLDDVINFILTTEELTDLPTIMDAVTERVASEMWLEADQWEAIEVEEAPVEETSTVESNEEETLPPLSL